MDSICEGIKCTMPTVCKERVMPKYIKKKALKNAIECCTWYHTNKNGELVEGANSAEHEPLYKYSDIKKIIKGLPTRKFEDEPQTCDTCKWGEWYRKGYDITMMDDECGGCCSWRSKWIPKDEP